jgi:hypothetical protein
MQQKMYQQKNKDILASSLETKVKKKDKCKNLCSPSKAGLSWRVKLSGQFITLHLTLLKDIALHFTLFKDLALHLTLLKDINNITIHFSKCLDHYAGMSSRHGINECESDC